MKPWKFLNRRNKIALLTIALSGSFFGTYSADAAVLVATIPSDYINSEMGTITGSFGGMLRDTLINEVPLIFRKDIYALACVFGGFIYYLCTFTGMSSSIIQFITAVSVFVIRVIAVKYHISVPVLKGEES